MYEIGEYVVYGSKGVCRIEDITQIDISGVDKGRLYYILAPMGDTKGKVYAPTDNQKIAMRKVITKEEANELIYELPDIELLWIENDKQREAKYKEIMRSGDYRALVSIIKTLRLRKKERVAQGKKVTSVDERYMRAAESELCDELSLAFDISKKDVEQYMKEKLKKR